MEDDVSFYFNRFKNYILHNSDKLLPGASSVLGFSRDDITQEARIIIWKALNTYRYDKNAKKDTYIMLLLNNFFINLYKKINSEKSKTKKFVALEAHYYDGEEHMTSVWEYYQDLFLDFESMFTTIEKKILFYHLEDNKTLAEMSRAIGVTKRELISSIKSIKRKMCHAS